MVVGRGCPNSSKEIDRAINKGSSKEEGRELQKITRAVMKQ
jgi:hypothetical protein